MSECGKYFVIELERRATETIAEDVGEKELENNYEEYAGEISELATDYYNDVKNNIQEAVLKAFKTAYKTDEWDGNQNYSGRIIARIRRFFGENWYEINVIIRAGYYSEANLDYTVEYSDDESEEKYQKSVAKDLTKLEAIFREEADEYDLMGVFSNGEAVYEKVKK
jgi:hypothetical protein